MVDSIWRIGCDWRSGFRRSPALVRRVTPDRVLAFVGPNPRSSSIAALKRLAAVRFRPWLPTPSLNKHETYASCAGNYLSQKYIRGVHLESKLATSPSPRCRLCGLRKRGDGKSLSLRCVATITTSPRLLRPKLSVRRIALAREMHVGGGDVGKAPGCLPCAWRTRVAGGVRRVGAVARRSFARRSEWSRLAPT